MNIKIITRHTPSNYGSILQSIATLRMLELLGHSAEIIDYQRVDERGLKMVKTLVNRKIGYKNLLKKTLYIVIRYPIEKLAQVRFDKMRKRYLKMTYRCSTNECLATLNADIFMTGSDQVWGPMMNGCYDPVYFLQFVPKGIKKIAYAASFGKTTFDVATEAVYEKMLAAYDKISLREDSGVRLVESWKGKNCVGQVLDPTLLFIDEEWANMMIAPYIQKKYEKKKYIIVYQIHNDIQLSSYAVRLAERTGLQLVRVNPYLHQVCRGGRFICCPDVGEFLALIKNSTYMVTDSFHGTCFALIFNKQFIEILPKNTTGTRNQSLLSLTGLSNRIVVDFNDFSILDRVIDYIPVNNILKNERMRSIEVMRFILE